MPATALRWSPSHALLSTRSCGVISPNLGEGREGGGREGGEGGREGGREERIIIVGSRTKVVILTCQVWEIA